MPIDEELLLPKELLTVAAVNAVDYAILSAQK